MRTGKKSPQRQMANMKMILNTMPSSPTGAHDSEKTSSLKVEIIISTSKANRIMLARLMIRYWLNILLGHCLPFSPLPRRCCPWVPQKSWERSSLAAETPWLSDNQRAGSTSFWINSKVTSWRWCGSPEGRLFWWKKRQGGPATRNESMSILGKPRWTISGRGKPLSRYRHIPSPCRCQKNGYWSSPRFRPRWKELWYFCTFLTLQLPPVRDVEKQQLDDESTDPVPQKGISAQITHFLVRVVVPVIDSVEAYRVNIAPQET